MMKAPRLKLASFVVGSLLLGGCQTLPVVPHAVGCDVNKELLAAKCAAPKPVANDVTYATLVDTMQADRKALRECSITADALREAIARCKQTTDEYNKKIDALNSRN
jgi:predicted small secreted protein